MPITLQFVEDDHFYDPIVEYVSHGWPTHVDALLPAEVINRSFVQEAGDVPAGSEYGLLGARPRGVVMIRKPGYSDFKRIARISLPVERETQEIAFHHWLGLQLGKPYDFADVFGFVTDEFPKPHGTEFCSMLILSALNVAKIFPQRPHCAAYAIDPWDLFLICSAFAPVQWIKK